ncbi:type II secretion system F family protein [Rhodovibrionaceae bacterium A322]
MTPDLLAFDMMSLLPWLLAGSAALTVMLVGNLFLGDRAANSRQVKKRLERVSQVGGSKTVVATRSALRRQSADSEIRSFDRLIKRLMPNPDKLRGRLAATGLNVKIGQYVLICMLLTLTPTVVLSQFLGLPFIIALAQGVLLGVGFPHFLIGHLGKRRVSAFIAQFPEAIDLMVRGLRSGLPITESLSVVGNEMTAPIGPEFKKVIQEVSIGGTLEDALWNATKRIQAPEFKFLVIALSIQRETGGNLTETLANLAELLRQRRQLKLKIKAMSAEAKASAYIIGALPFVMFGLIWMVNSEYLGPLFSDPRGLIMAGVSLTMILLGAFVMFKMVRFEI